MHVKRIIILATLLIVFGLVFWSSASLQENFFEVVRFIEPYFNSQPILGGILFVILGALSAMISCFSSVPLVPAAILWWGKFPSFSLLLAGWILGAGLAYAVGWYAGHPFVRRLLVFHKIESFEKKLSKKVAFEIVLLFRLAMPAEVSGYVLGTLRYNFWQYLMATFLAEIPFAAAAVYASEALLEKKPVVYIAIATIAAVLISVFLHAFHKILAKTRRKRSSPSRKRGLLLQLKKNFSYTR